MFGFESELFIILLVALVVVGPKDLPRLMRIAGRWVARARAMADQFKASFDEMARESELDDLRRELAALRSANPVTQLKDEINRSILPPDAAPPVKSMLGESEAAPHPDAPAPDSVHDMPDDAASEAHAVPPPAPGLTPTEP